MMKEVLILEDSGSLRIQLGHFFEDMDFKVSAVETIKDVYATLKEGLQPNLFILSCASKKESDLDLLKSIKEKHEFESTPVVAMTDDVETDSIQNLITAGADECILKPFEEEALLSKLRILGLVV